MMWKSIASVLMLTTLIAAQEELPPYVLQCRRSDPELNACLKGALHHLKPYLAKGIPEIKLPPVEPFVMDQLSLQLTGGPQGYRINLKNMEVFGASNFTVKAMKLSDGEKPFEARLTIPKLLIHAKYTSSGVLIIIPASGSGDFDAVFDGVTADVRGRVSFNEKATGTHMRLDTLDLNLSIKKPRLSVSKIFNNNRILTEATNLFLKENGNEVLRALQPQLQKKLSAEFLGIANQLLENVPLNGVTADVRGRVSFNEKATGTHMRLDTLDLNLSIKKPRLSVSKIFNNNRILTEATNLFLKENGNEVLRALQPQLQKKLSAEFLGIANQLLENVPLNGVTADVRGRVSFNEKATGTHMRLDTLDLNLSIKKPRLSVSKIFNNNRILTEATNLFLKENGNEVLRALQPQLQKKLSAEFLGIANQLLENVPLSNFLID